MGVVSFFYKLPSKIQKSGSNYVAKDLKGAEYRIRKAKKGDERILGFDDYTFKDFVEDEGKYFAEVKKPGSKEWEWIGNQDNVGGLQTYLDELLPYDLDELTPKEFGQAFKGFSGDFDSFLSDFDNYDDQFVDELKNLGRGIIPDTKDGIDKVQRKLDFVKAHNDTELLAKLRIGADDSSGGSSLFETWINELDVKSALKDAEKFNLTLPELVEKYKKDIGKATFGWSDAENVEALIKNSSMMDKQLGASKLDKFLKKAIKDDQLAEQAAKAKRSVDIYREESSNAYREYMQDWNDGYNGTFDEYEQVALDNTLSRIEELGDSVDVFSVRREMENGPEGLWSPDDRKSLVGDLTDQRMKNNNQDILIDDGESFASIDDYYDEKLNADYGRSLVEMSPEDVKDELLATFESNPGLATELLGVPDSISPAGFRNYVNELFDKGDLEDRLSSVSPELSKPKKPILSIIDGGKQEGSIDPKALGALGASAALLGTLGYSPEAESGVITRNGKKLIEAYHGTPHHVDKFSMDKIGTGEGAQAFGHGLYFAENPNIAKDYKRKLSQGLARKNQINGQTYPDELWEETLAPIMQKYNIPGDIDPSQSHEGMIREMLDNNREKMTPEDIKTLEKYAAPEGNFYKVELDIDPDTEMLDWDLPFSEQSEFVQERILSAGIKDFMTDKPLTIADMDAKGWRVEQLIEKFGGAEESSANLNKLGIKGIRYDDGLSRSTNIKQKNKNFVVFDDSLITIAEKNGIPFEQVTKLANEKGITNQQALSMLVGGSTGMALMGGSQDAEATPEFIDRAENPDIDLNWNPGYQDGSLVGQQMDQMEYVEDWITNQANRLNVNRGEIANRLQDINIKQRNSNLRENGQISGSLFDTVKFLDSMQDQEEQRMSSIRDAAKQKWMSGLNPSDLQEVNMLEETIAMAEEFGEADIANKARQRLSDRQAEYLINTPDFMFADYGALSAERQKPVDYIGSALGYKSDNNRPEMHGEYNPNTYSSRLADDIEDSGFYSLKNPISWFLPDPTSALRFGGDIATSYHGNPWQESDLSRAGWAALEFAEPAIIGGRAVGKFAGKAIDKLPINTAPGSFLGDTKAAASEAASYLPFNKLIDNAPVRYLQGKASAFRDLLNPDYTDPKYIDRKNIYGDF